MESKLLAKQHRHSVFLFFGLIAFSSLVFIIETILDKGVDVALEIFCKKMLQFQED